MYSVLAVQIQKLSKVNITNPFLMTFKYTRLSSKGLLKYISKHIVYTMIVSCQYPSSD